MRLLDTRTGRFVTVPSHHGLEYAILSHTWDSKGEQSYQDVSLLQGSRTFRFETIVIWTCVEIWWRLLLCLSSILDANALFRSRRSEDDSQVLSRVCRYADHIRRMSRQLREQNSFFIPPRYSAKIRRACMAARAHGHSLIWIDSCCIDKTSSSELSEAINSMFLWYRDATVCYAYLSDVPIDDDIGAIRSAFRESRWFKRGWTLQELLAPRVLVFLSQEWYFMGTKSTLADLVERVTGIERQILRGEARLDQVSVAKRMSWAAERRTTRLEDEAYALLGIFNINMPTLYGEGRRAFVRLQEEILKRVPDQSLFAWGAACLYPQQLPLHNEINHHNRYHLHGRHSHSTPLFADSPSSFAECKNFRNITHDRLAERLGLPANSLPTYTTTPYGVQTQFPLVPVECLLPQAPVLTVKGYNPVESPCFAILACESTVKQVHYLLAIVCTVKRSQSDGLAIMHGSELGCSRGYQHAAFRVVALSPAHVDLSKLFVRTEALYIPAETVVPRHPRLNTVFDVELARWSASVLCAQGYTVASQNDGCGRHGLLLEKGETGISVKFGKFWKPSKDILVWAIPFRAGSPVTNAEQHSPPSATFDGYRDRDRKAFTFADGTGRTVTMRFTMLQFSEVWCLDVEVLTPEEDVVRAMNLAPMDAWDREDDCSADVGDDHSVHRWYMQEDEA